MRTNIILLTLLFGSAQQDKWSTSYCPTDGCIAKCQHLQQFDRGGTWCGASIPQRFVSGDINNDGLCDAVCIDLALGVVNVGYRGSSSFRDVRVTNMFCGGITSGYYPLILDVNNDTFDDILCVFDDVPNDDQVRVYYVAGKAADMTFPETVISNITLSSSVIARYGNQTLTDKELYKIRPCTKYQSQCNHIKVDFPVAQFRYYGDHPYCSNNRLYSGDFDGDGYCDIACHTARNTLNIMLYTVDMRRLHPPHWVAAKDGYVATLCNYNLQYMAVIDLDRDGHVEIICGESPNPAVYPYKVRSTRYPDNGPYVAHDAVSGWFQINSSDIFNLDGHDPMVACSTSVKHASGSGLVNPCENITLNAAYLQGDAVSVLDTTVGSFCRDASTSLFISADVDGNGYCDMICQDNIASPETSVYVQYLTNDGLTYETRHNVPVGTAGLGSNFTCFDQLYTFDFNGDDRWDLLCIHSIVPFICGMQLNITYWLAQDDSTGFSPDTVTLSKVLKSDILLGSQTCPPECKDFSVSNGVVKYDETRLRFEVACKPGYQLRGRRFIGCALGSYYMSAFPLCRENTPDHNYHVSAANSLVSIFPSDKFLYSAFDPLKVFINYSLHDCIWTCDANTECISATMDDNVCKLFAYQANIQERGYGNMFIILLF